ncbi:MAG: carboxypeptidase regulatory-like domain-containing protein [bacterium]
MTAPDRWTIAALLVLSALAEPAGAQSGGVILTGRVVGPDGAPALLAAVAVTALDDQSTVVELTDGNGRFRAAMEHRATTYAVSVRLRGFAAQSRPIAVGIADTIVNVPDFRLVRSAQDLPAVRVVSRRPPPVRNQGRYGLYLQKPGESAVSLDPSSGFGAALTGDASGDMTLALGAVPGVSVTPGADGALSFSVAGLGAEQNRLTMNGADVVVPPPRGSGVLRVSTTGYDPTIAMSGALAEWLIVGANYLVDRHVRLTMDARPLQIATPVSDAVGQGAGAPTELSGVISGPLWRTERAFVPKFFTTSFDVRRRATDVSTLVSTDAPTLAEFGVASESVRRVLAARESQGLPVFASGTVGQRSTSARLSTRVDFTKGSLGNIGTNAIGGASASERQDQARVFYLMFGGSTARDAGALVGPLTTPSYGADHSSTGLTAQVFHSGYLREFLVNETRLTFSSARTHGGPVSPLPSGNVLVGSATSGDASGISSVQVAGSGGATLESRYKMAQLYNETQWTSVGGRHQWKLGVEALVDDATSSRGASAGRFLFASADDFIANRPSAYSRSLSQALSDAHGVHLAAGLGDEFHPSKAWSWQYGMRLEGHGIRDEGARNPVVDSIFGVHSGVIPMKLSVSPMVGFTWFYGQPWGKNAFGFPSSYYSLVGGIRDYRGTLSTRQTQSALAESGLPDAARELLCVGDAAPAPDWRAYASSNASIPDHCTGAGDASPLVQSGLPVSVYSSDYTASHSWRADLAWNTRLSARLFSTLHGRLALNTRQPSPFDLNFAGTPRLALAEESGRPVFVSPTSFDPASGQTTTTESRRYAAYGRVNELRSELGSRDASITAQLEFRPTITRLSSNRALPFRIAYTLSGGRAQSDGFLGTTADDPRRTEWAPASGSRHALLFATAFHVPDWARLTAGLQLRSGSRFTPLVLGDLNGDGRSNDDRAFVFDPRVAGDVALGSGMSALVSDAQPYAARCLSRQLGAIAGANSCTGPWTATLNSRLTIDPARVGLRNRGRIEIAMTNVLAAVDELVHGARGVHGWGQPAIPDPVLLHVTGFDPATRRVRYAVNQMFGDTRVYRNFFQQPFRVSIDVSLDLGPNREREAMLRRVAPKGRRVHLDSLQLVELIANPNRLLDPIINRPDVLELTDVQIATLQKLSRRYEAEKDSIYGTLAGYLIARDGDIADRGAQRHWHEANAAIGWKIWETGVAVRSVLSDTQWTLLLEGSRPAIYEYFKMDRREIAKALATWQIFPY